MSWIPPGPALLFCPADRPDRVHKAAALADMVIIDLEDGVAPHDRPAAREALSVSNLDPDRTMVRVNPSGTVEHALDLEALARTPYDIVMLAKTEHPDQVEALLPRRVVALCETPLGVLNAVDIARARATVAMMWGAEDLVAALGGDSSRGPAGSYRDIARHARAHVLMAAGAFGRAGIDAVHLDIADLAGLAEEATDASASGFAGTACIHPSQVPVVRASYEPTETDIAWARAVLEKSRTAAGVFVFEGRMVDGPVLRQAEQILRRSDRNRREQL